MSSNTDSGREERIVSVTEKGQATIPKSLRERHGIPAPGRVKFVENDDGEIVVRPVGSMREFRGLERTDDEDEPATAVLDESRTADRQDADGLVERHAGSGGRGASHSESDENGGRGFDHDERSERGTGHDESDGPRDGGE